MDGIDYKHCVFLLLMIAHYFHRNEKKNVWTTHRMIHSAMNSLASLTVYLAGSLARVQQNNNPIVLKWS